MSERRNCIYKVYVLCVISYSTAHVHAQREEKLLITTDGLERLFGVRIYLIYRKAAQKLQLQKSTIFVDKILPRARILTH